MIHIVLFIYTILVLYGCLFLSSWSIQNKIRYVLSLIAFDIYAIFWDVLLDDSYSSGISFFIICNTLKCTLICKIVKGSYFSTVCCTYCNMYMEDHLKRTEKLLFLLELCVEKILNFT